jgi:hypothetical protein
MPYFPPPTVVAPTVLTDAGTWAATTFYPLNSTYFAPANGSAPAGERRLVTNPAGYTSGGSYGTTDTNNTQPLGPSMATLAGDFAPLGASYKFAIAASGETVTSAMPLQSNGIPIAGSVTVADMEIDMDFPPVGGSCVWRFSRWRYSDPSDTLIGSVTVADGKRSGVNGGTGLSTGVTLQAGDRILVRNTASNGSTFPGQAITAYVSFSGLLPVMPSPATAPTTLTVTPTSSSLTLSWVAGSVATGHLIYRDGIPYALTGATTFIDAGLGVSESHTYAVAAVSPGGMSALTSGVAGTTTASYSYYPTGTGTLSSLAGTDFTVTLGSDTGTAANLASNILTLTCGWTGSNAQQDRVAVVFIKDSGSHSAWKRAWKMGFNGNSALTDMYFGASAFVNFATAFTYGLQLEMTPNNYRFGFKAPSIGSGSFQNMTTGTGGATALATKTASSGQVTYSAGTITADGAHFIGCVLDMQPIAGDGSQTIYWYTGTTAQLDTYLAGGALPPLDNTLTLSQPNRHGIDIASGGPGGYHYIQHLGIQGSTGAGTSAANQSYLERDVRITPQTASGV